MTRIDDDTLRAEIGRQLAKTRVRRGVSIDALARETGLMRYSIVRVEAGKAAMHHVEMVAQAHGMTLDQICDSAWDALRRSDGIELSW